MLGTRASQHRLQLICVAALSLLVGAQGSQAAPGDNAAPKLTRPLIPVCISAHFHACGLLDRSGKWVVEPRYSAIFENGEYWTVERESGVVGLLDAQGRERIPARFRFIGEFVDGLAAATLLGPSDTLSGYIDTRGEWVIEPKFLYTEPFHGKTTIATLGPNYEQSQLVLLRRDGSTEPLPFDQLIRAKDGRYVVGRGEINVYDCAGLDEQGRVLVPISKGCGLEIVPGAGWTKNDVARTDGQRESQVLDRNGKIMARITGPEPWIAEADTSGLARFLTDGTLEGLLDARTGRVIVPPRIERILGVSEGMVGVATEEGVGFLDARGRVVIPPRFRYASEFAHGRAVVTLAGSQRESTGVIDRAGNLLPAFDKLRPDRIELSAWESAPQSPVRRDIARVSSGDTVYLTTLDGDVIATLRKLPECDAQSLFDAGGKLLWPRYPKQSCAIRNYQQPDATSSEEFRLAYRERLDFEKALEQERAIVDRQGGGLLNVLDRERSKRRAVLDAAPWIKAPQVVRLGREAEFTLPAGYRYLSAEAVEQFAQREWLVPAGVSGLAVLEAPDGRWRAHIRVLDSGAVDFVTPLPRSEDLLTLLRARRFGLFADQPAPHLGSSLLMSWLVEPVVDPGRRRLVFALRADDYANASGSRILQVVKFGYTQTIVVMVDFSGMLRMNDLEYYQGDVVELVDSILVREPTAKPPLDPRGQSARLSAKDFVTGVATDKEKAFLKRLDDETNPFSRDNLLDALTKALGPLGLLLTLLALRWRQRAQ